MRDYICYCDHGSLHNKLSNGFKSGIIQLYPPFDHSMWTGVGMKGKEPWMQQMADVTVTQATEIRKNHRRMELPKGDVLLVFEVRPRGIPACSMCSGISWNF